MICMRCGRDISEHQVVRHDEACIERQEVRIRIGLSMADPLRPGWGRTMRNYDRTRLPGSVSGDTLRLYFGTWNEALCVFGLFPPNARKKRHK